MTFLFLVVVVMIIIIIIAEIKVTLSLKSCGGSAMTHICRLQLDSSPDLDIYTKLT